MKKIALAMMAVVLSLSVMAQESKSDNGKTRKHKEFRNKHFKAEEKFDKLNLTDAQKAQMKTINESFRQQMQDLNKQGNITVDEQKQRRAALVKEHREKIESMLTTEQRKQAETFKEYREGKKGDVGHERMEELGKDLNLTPEQSAKMSALNSTFRSRLQSLRQNSSLSKEEKRDQMKTMMKQHRSDMEALLTKDQKEQMKSHRKNRPNRTFVK